MQLLKSRRLFILTFCLGTLGIFAVFSQFSVTFEPAVSEVAAISKENHAQDSIPQGSSLAIADTATTNSTTTTPKKLLAYGSNFNNNGTQGKLRASNQTNHPVRLALLTRNPAHSSLKSDSKSANISKNHLPVHWDFAPQEGSSTGMLLSLPNGNLTLEPGDIIVAFAQDGSRRYWGPYVVGETPYPLWNPQSQEWQLILPGNGDK